MKNKLIIKGFIFLMVALVSINCKKNNPKPVTPIPASGTGSVTFSTSPTGVGGVTYNGTCRLLPGDEVQIINLTGATPFLLRVFGMPQQSSGVFTFNRNTPGALTAVFSENSATYQPGNANVGQVTKIGANSFTFFSTMYTAPVGAGGNPGTVPFYLTGGGTY